MSRERVVHVRVGGEVLRNLRHTSRWGGKRCYRSEKILIILNLSESEIRPLPNISWSRIYGWGCCCCCWKCWSYKSVALEDLKKTKPVAAAAELAARLSKQPRTAAAADCKVFKWVRAKISSFECIEIPTWNMQCTLYNEEDYSLSILLVVLVVGIVVRARAEMLQKSKTIQQNTMRARWN